MSGYEARAKSGLRNRLYYKLGNFIPYLMIVLMLILVGYGSYLRLRPAEKYGFVIDDFYSWSALSGLALKGEPSLALSFIAGIFRDAGLAEEAVALFPIAAWLVSVVGVYYILSRFEKSLAAPFIALLPLAVATSSLQATSLGRSSWDTPGLIATAFVYSLLAYAIVSAREKELYTRVSYMLAGLIAGISSLFWGGYFLVLLSLVVYIILASLNGVKPRLLFYLSLGALAGLSASYLGNPEDLLRGEPALFALLTIVLFLASRKPGDLKSHERFLVAWSSLGLVVLYILSLLSGFSTKPELVAEALVGVMDLRSIFSQRPDDLSWSFVLRDFGLWGFLALLPVIKALYTYLGTRRLDKVDLFSLSVAVPAATALAISLTYTSLPILTAITSISILSGLSINTLRATGFLSSRDELTLTLASALAVSLVFSGAYIAYSGYQFSLSYAPLTAGSQAIVSNEPQGGPGFSDAWMLAAELLSEADPENSIVYTWPAFAPIIEAMTRLEAVDVSDGELMLFALSRLMVGDEGEASYILSSVEGLKSKQAYIVLREVFLGSYDAQTGLVLLYPRPVLVQSLGSLSFVIQGVGDLNHLYFYLIAAEELEEGSTPFDGGWYSEAVVQGFSTRMFPGLYGNPSDNVSRVRDSLLVKLLIDTVLKLSTNSVIGSGCDFLPGNATFTMGVFLQTPGGGVVQPLFVLEEPENFEIIGAVISCPQILSDTGLRIEFTAEVIAVYKWKGGSESS